MLVGAFVFDAPGLSIDVIWELWLVHRRIILVTPHDEARHRAEAMRRQRHAGTSRHDTASHDGGLWHVAVGCRALDAADGWFNAFSDGLSRSVLAYGRSQLDPDVASAEEALMGSLEIRSLPLDVAPVMEDLAVIPLQASLRWFPDAGTSKMDVHARAHVLA